MKLFSLAVLVSLAVFACGACTTPPNATASAPLVEAATDQAAGTPLEDRTEPMNDDEYRKSNFTDPVPEPRYHFTGGLGVSLYFQAFDSAVSYYAEVLGPPAYVEGDEARGWPIGSGWLTLLRGGSGGPRNVEVTLRLETSEAAEAMQRAFIRAGGEGPAPSDEVMYEPVRFCAVRDPFGTEILIVSPLVDGKD